MTRIKRRNIVGNISIYGEEYLKNEADNTTDEWGYHVGRMREIDQLEIVDENISKEDLEKVIRATHIGKFGPKLILHGHTFQYRK